MRGERIIRRCLQRYWRWQRGLTLGVRGVVVDTQNRVLLVRQTYSSGWIFPGGGVEYGETVEDALRRELAEEANIELTAPGVLFGIYSNGTIYPGDHVAIYRIPGWHQTSAPRPNNEIAETGFFPVDDLPAATTPGTRRRLDELLRGAPPSPHW
jgi:8-oxo-dGTP pyrophosphatase MutT (NUDIX family)